MAVAGMFVVAVVAVLATLGVWSAARRRPPLIAVSPQIESLVRSAGRRTVRAALTSAGVFVLLVIIGSVTPRLLGVPFAIAAGLGATAGLLVYAARPPRTVTVAPTSARQASLTRRTPLSYLPLRATIGLLILVSAQLAFLVFTGVTSSPDDSGHYRQIAFQQGNQASTAGPYPGWFYAIPLLIVTGLLLAATMISLWRVSTVAALPTANHSSIDARWRRATNRVIIMIGLAAVLFQAGGVAVFAGSAVYNAGHSGIPTWVIPGWSVTVIGYIGLVAGVVAFALGALRALALPQTLGLETRSSDTGHPAATATS